MFGCEISEEEAKRREKAWGYCFCQYHLQGEMKGGRDEICMSWVRVMSEVLSMCLCVRNVCPECANAW